MISMLLIALSEFFNDRKIVFRFRPLNGIKSFGFIFGMCTEIFGSDFQGPLRFLGPFLTPKWQVPPQSEVWLTPVSFESLLSDPVLRVQRVVSAWIFCVFSCKGFFIAKWILGCQSKTSTE